MNELAIWLNTEIKRRGWSQSELARRMGNAFSRTMVSRVINSGHTPSFEFCKAIAVVFEIRDVSVLRMAGLIDPLPYAETSIEHEAIKEFRQLQDEEQAHFVRQMRAMNLTRSLRLPEE